MSQSEDPGKMGVENMVLECAFTWNFHISACSCWKKTYKNGELALFSRRRRRYLHISIEYGKMGVENMIFECCESISLEIFVFSPSVFEKTANLHCFRGEGGEFSIFWCIYGKMGICNLLLECAESISLAIFMTPPSVVEKTLKNGEFGLFSRWRRRMLRVLVQMDVQNMVLECPGSISFESFMIPPAVVEKMLQNGEYSQISRRRRRMLHILMQICQDGYLKYGFSMSWVHFWAFEGHSVVGIWDNDDKTL